MRKEKNKAEFKKGSVQLQPGWARQGEKVVAWTTELQTRWSSPEGTRGGCPAPQLGHPEQVHRRSSLFLTYKMNKTTPRPLPILEYYKANAVWSPRIPYRQVSSSNRGTVSILPAMSEGWYLKVGRTIQVKIMDSGGSHTTSRPSPVI